MLDKNVKYVIKHLDAVSRKVYNREYKTPQEAMKAIDKVTSWMCDHGQGIVDYLIMINDDLHMSVDRNNDWVCSDHPDHLTWNDVNAYIDEIQMIYLHPSVKELGEHIPIPSDVGKIYKPGHGPNDSDGRLPH